MQRLTAWTIIAVGAWVTLGCKKEKNTAVVEEVPAATATAGDTATSLADEPSLEKVRGKQNRSAPATFHTQKGASNAAFSEKGKFVVQVSVFKNKRQAKQMMEKLSAAGYPAYVASVESPTPELSGMYHRVRIGNFASLHEAYTFGENTLKPQGYSYWIDKKKNDHRSSGVAESSPAPAPSSAPAAESFSTPPASQSSPSEAPSPPATAPTPRTPAAVPAAPAPEPVGVPEPPAPSEPAPPQDNAWGNPLTDSAKGSTPAGGAAPAAHKDTSGGAVEGW